MDGTPSGRAGDKQVGRFHEGGGTRHPSGGPLEGRAARVVAKHCAAKQQSSADPRCPLRPPPAQRPLHQTSRQDVVLSSGQGLAGHARDTLGHSRPRRDATILDETVSASARRRSPPCPPVGRAAARAHKPFDRGWWRRAPHGGVGLSRHGQDPRPVPGAMTTPCRLGFMEGTLGGGGGGGGGGGEEEATRVRRPALAGPALAGDARDDSRRPTDPRLENLGLARGCGLGARAHAARVYLTPSTSIC